MRKIMTLAMVLVLTIVGVMAMVNPVASCNGVDFGKNNQPICRYDVPFSNDAVPLGTKVYWDLSIYVKNRNTYTIENVVVKDRLGAELELRLDDPENEGITPLCTKGTWSYETKGNSDKVFLLWEIGNLGPGEDAELVLTVATDLNPAGKQEYTSPCWHMWNSGATIKWIYDGKQYSKSTDAEWVKVVGEEEE